MTNLRILFIKTNIYFESMYSYIYVMIKIQIIFPILLLYKFSLVLHIYIYIYIGCIQYFQLFFSLDIHFRCLSIYFPRHNVSWVRGCIYVYIYIFPFSASHFFLPKNQPYIMFHALPAIVGIKSLFNIIYVCVYTCLCNKHLLHYKSRNVSYQVQPVRYQSQPGHDPQGYPANNQRHYHWSRFWQQFNKLLIQALNVTQRHKRSYPTSY